MTSSFTAVIGSSFSQKAFSNYLHQDYINHINSNSSDAIKTIALQVDLLILTISCTLQFLTCVCVSASIFLMLFAINWKLAFISGGLLSILYLTVAF